MATITTRSGKGSPLTNTELDANFTNLNSDKQEVLAEGSFADGDKTKLDGIESGATADQTASEIKTAYESNADTNAFTDAEQTKLSGIETGADVTDTTNVTAAGALMDSELTNITAVKALNQGVATTDEPSWDGVNLNAISASIADTAVDVFVYDTRKDSDGGAWRKRCQHTSWYNETLNTSTRGSRKEFPSVAVIVAESTQVTIYDGDDPDMPMWMVFNAGANYFINQASATVKAVSMLNGVLAVSESSGSLTFGLADFIADDMEIIRSAYNDKAREIVNRNSVIWTGNKAVRYIVNDIANDIAMTVLPNAPIDDATGLPIPTIAVATNGGVSVITDSGNVYDYTWSTDDYTQVVFRDSYLLMGGSSDVVAVIDVPTSGDTSYYAADHIAFYRTTTSNSLLKFLGASGVNSKHCTFNSVGTAQGLTQFDHNLPNRAGNVYLNGSWDNTGALTNFITSSYNTGWMNGDIKLATLSDTDDTDVTASYFETAFDDSTGWSSVATGYTISGGVLSHASGTGNELVSTFTPVAGKTYVISYDVTSFSGGYIRPHLGGVGAYLNSTGSVTLTATTTETFRIKTGTDGVWSIDNLSVRLAEEDRSVNGNGLQVFGTVTKNPVATGADLVAYSGFSASNYLQQPYNSDLDFGTGDFCFTFWQKHNTLARERSIASFGAWNGTSWSGSLIHIRHQDDNTLYVYISDDGFSTWDSSASSALSKNVWNNICLVRRASKAYIYINGVQDTSFSISNASASLSNSSATVMLGNVQSSLSLYGYSEGSLALFRVSKTAPSAEQIAKIYEDEKVLFQENAQATLYGSSDAVTALAYDDDTNLLHVGTSSGRSDFNGLRRVNNTTDAVGAAISASNGLIAED